MTPNNPASITPTSNPTNSKKANYTPISSMRMENIRMTMTMTIQWMINSISLRIVQISTIIMQNRILRRESRILEINMEVEIVLFR